MSKFIPVCGLPRSGSTILVNILNQNPNITISPDSILSTMVLNAQETFSQSVSESQYDADTSYEMFANFCRSGMESWISTISKTPYYIDKCRSWGHQLDFLFKIYPEIKIILIIRDLRGIASSIEKIQKNTVMEYKSDFLFGDQPYDFNKEDLYINKVQNAFETCMLRKNLICIKEILDVRREYFDSIKIIRYEDLILETNYTIDTIYDHLNIPKFSHDLDNIKQHPYHDSFYLPYGRHKVKTRIEKFDPYKFLVPPKIQDFLMEKYSWYYEEFYPDQI